MNTVHTTNIRQFTKCIHEVLYMHKCRTRGAATTFVQCTTHKLGTRSAVLNVGASSTNDTICTTMKYIYSKRRKNASDMEKKFTTQVQPGPNHSLNRSAPTVGESFWATMHGAGHTWAHKLEK